MQRLSAAKLFPSKQPRPTARPLRSPLLRKPVSCDSDPLRNSSLSSARLVPPSSVSWRSRAPRRAPSQAGSADANREQAEGGKGPGRTGPWWQGDLGQRARGGGRESGAEGKDRACKMLRTGETGLPRRSGARTFRRRVGGGASGERMGVLLPTKGNPEGQVSEDETSQESELQSEALNWGAAGEVGLGTWKMGAPAVWALGSVGDRPSLGDPLRAAPGAPGTAQAVRPVRKPLAESQIRVPGHEWRGPLRRCAVPCARVSQAQVAASDASLRPWQHRCLRNPAKRGHSTNAERAETTRERDSRSILT